MVALVRGVIRVCVPCRALDVRAGSEVDVGAGESGELGGSQSGLRGEHEHRVVAPAGPGGRGLGRRAARRALVR